MLSIDEILEGVDGFTDPVAQAKKLVAEAGEDIDKRQIALNKVCVLLATEKLTTKRDDQMDAVAKIFGYKKTKIKGIVNDLIKINTIDYTNGEDRKRIPAWVDTNKLFTDGFAMNFDKEADRIGIYYDNGSMVTRLTNYGLKPLYFIADAIHSRRLIEVTNGFKTHVVELPNKAFTSQDAFETELIAKGAYYSEPGFSKNHFKRLVNWVSDSLPTVHELKTLGWQPEGFFAFSNRIVKGNVLHTYNEYGIAMIDECGYLSSGVSKLNQDVRQEDNIYENDLYLHYAQSPISFKQWIELFCKVYGEDAQIALAFIFITAFKDIVTKVTKCPHFYCYGPKGSGKSALAESMMWFFFSGKNAEGKLIQGYNLNPGQGTPFSFFSRLQRFRNCAMLYNEYDPNSVEAWKKGTIKSAFDGEGREVGSGETGKKRKTEIQKVQGTMIIAGQYVDLTDDGAILSRSVINKFSLEKNKNRTDEQKKLWDDLSDYERQGISSLAAGLFEHRNAVQKDLKHEFWQMNKKLNADLRAKKRVIESRLLNNYSLCLSMIKIMGYQLELPFTFEEFYGNVFNRISAHAEMLRENNALNAFWKTIEVLFDESVIINNVHFRLKAENSVTYYDDGEKHSKMFHESKRVMYVRFNMIYDKYAKRFREKANRTPPDEDTLIVYLQDQPYYLGLNPSTRFKDKVTSCYMIDYSMLEQSVGINFEKIEQEPGIEDDPKSAKAADDMPF